MVAPIKYEDIPQNVSNIDVAKRDVLDFFHTQQKAGEVILNGRNVYKAQSAFKEAIRRLNIPMEQMVRKNRLFLVRTDI